MQRLPFAEELGAEHDPVAAEAFASGGNVTHRDSRLDHDDRPVVRRKHVFDYGIDRGSVEEIGIDIVIGRHCHDGELRPCDGFGKIGREGQVEVGFGKVLLHQCVLDRRLAIPKHGHAIGRYVAADNRVVLGEHDGV